MKATLKHSISLVGVLFIVGELVHNVRLTRNAPGVACNPDHSSEVSASLRLLAATTTTTDNSTSLPSLQSIIPDSSTGKLFSGEKIREFDLPKANLRKTSHSTELPFENDFKNKCTKWGVVTTIFDPTEAISRVSNLPSWCLVVVADTKTPTDYMEKFEAIGGSTESTYFFSVEKQKQWEQLDGPIGGFVRTMPWRHFGRKNLGYLFAILHGAEFFFDFDDDNYIKLDNTTGKPVEILPSTTALDDVTVAIVGPTAFNHHPMMKPSIAAPSWARGFPLEYIKDEAMEGQALFKKSMPFMSIHGSIAVIQFLADGNPDVDAIHRLMRPLPVTFDNTADATSVLVPKHSYSPYNAQASIHTQPALWATLLPTTVPGRVSDIWRSYFAQCIFADSNLRLVFAPPKIEQIRNAHNILGDFNAENDLYQKSGKLLDFLSSWGSENLYFPDRVEQLWIDLYERSYIELDDVVAMQKWLEALKAMKYRFPELKPRHRNVALMGQFNFAHFPNSVTQMMVWSQKMREYFQTVIPAAPLNNSQLAFLVAHRIDAMQTEQTDPELSGSGLGYYSPMSNLMRTLLRFENSSTIEAVLYAHDDALLNFTELTGGKYPFETSKIIANRRKSVDDNMEYVDLRTIVDREKARSHSHRVFPNGTVSDADKTFFTNSIAFLKKHIPGFHENWEHWITPYCAIGQQNMAMDPEYAKYLESDGSAYFQCHTQADFLMVPTKYAEPFAEAAKLHLKHKVWIECAFGTIVDILRRQLDAPVRLVKLCTSYNQHWRLRNQFRLLKTCASSPTAIMHPFKIMERYEKYWNFADQMNSHMVW